MTLSWWGVPGVLVLVLAWIGATAALRVRPRRRINRLLALVLTLEGLYGAGNFGFIFFVTDPAWARAFALMGAIGMAILPFEYLVFLGEALRTPLVRPLRTKVGAWAAHVAGMLVVGSILVFPSAFITPLYHPAWAPWNFTYTNLGPRLVQFHGIVSLFGLVVSIHAFTLAPAGSTARNRALLFIAAFGLRDAFIALIQILMPVLRPVPFWGDLIYNPVHAMVYAVYVPVLAYSILRYQLLDIELRVRFALTQGTVGAVIAIVFLVVSEAVESAVPVRGVVAGVVLALVVAAVLRPAQLVAERIANRLMPDVRPEPKYLEERRLKVFQSALEGALEDGEISSREDAILERLRAQLDISPEEAERMMGAARRVIGSSGGGRGAFDVRPSTGAESP